MRALRRPWPALLALPLVTALGACSARGTAWQLGLGSFATDLLVTQAQERGPYLDATLTGHGLYLRTFAPATPACAFVLQQEARVDYVERGIAGRFQRGGQTCEAVGFGEPLVRGARQPRATSLTESPVPRSQATFEPIFHDEELILLRGRFPEARRIGWTGTDDTVVAVPGSAPCRRAAQDGVASMEYRPAGRRTLSLSASDGSCPIVGLMLPQTEPLAEEGDGA